MSFKRKQCSQMVAVSWVEEDWILWPQCFMGVHRLPCKCLKLSLDPGWYFKDYVSVWEHSASFRLSLGVSLKSKKAHGLTVADNPLSAYPGVRQRKSSGYLILWETHEWCGGTCHAEDRGESLPTGFWKPLSSLRNSDVSPGSISGCEMYMITAF